MQAARKVLLMINPNQGNCPKASHTRWPILAHWDKVFWWAKIVPRDTVTRDTVGQDWLHCPKILGLVPLSQRDNAL